MNYTTSTSEVNGVNLEQLGQAVQSIQENPRAGDYRFYTETRWVNGAVSLSEVIRWKKESEGSPAQKFVAHEIYTDEPAGLLGTDTAANPVETVLAGLAGCLVIGLSYNAAARGIKIEELKIRLEGSLNLQGFLGLDSSVRPGYDLIRLVFDIRSQADPQEIRQLIDHVQKTSPVLDIITQPVPLHTSLHIQ